MFRTPAPRLAHRAIPLSLFRFLRKRRDGRLAHWRQPPLSLYYYNAPQSLSNSDTNFTANPNLVDALQSASSYSGSSHTISHQNAPPGFPRENPLLSLVSLSQKLLTQSCFSRISTTCRCCPPSKAISTRSSALAVTSAKVCP